jgi:nitroreductase
METIQAIRTRRAVRSWLDQNIPDEILSQILEAGQWSPSPLNSQPWHFIVIKQKETLSNLTGTASLGGG